MAIFKSNLMNVIEKGNRINSVFYRGELLNITAGFKAGPAALALADQIVLCPIGLHSVIKDIYISESSNTLTTFNVLLLGKKNDTFSLIKNLTTNPMDFVTIPQVPGVAAGVAVPAIAARRLTNSILPPDVRQKSLFEQCHTYDANTKTFTPIPALVDAAHDIDFSQDARVYLGLQMVGVAVPANCEITMNVTFTEQSPSTAAQFGIGYDGDFTPVLG